ncbi:MAG TPA: DUF1684 domain-containing protein [Chitinophagaceae bacterium]|nr:DUF1684 domain-containing protein [Chitinophagaceae bacterium]
MNILSVVTARVFLFIAMMIMAAGVRAQLRTAYHDEIEQWHKQRIKDLRSENGWLNLVGLYWLSPGKNSFGSGPGVAVRFPEGTMPADAGYFELIDATVRMVVKNGVNITVNGKPVQEAVVFDKDSARETQLGPLKWNIIRRGDKFGVRIRNLESLAVKDFKGIERYEVDSAWRISAVLEPSVPGGIAIKNVLGQTSTVSSPGKLVFTLGGKRYSLDALDDNGDELFIIFGDETNGVDTYPSGRYVYVKNPGPNGATILDFNKAYNPPCAFTDHATCPLPPPQNLLPLAITAGEKNYGTHK